MKFNLYKLIYTCFGLGHISPYPGTVASFFTIIIIWIIQTHFTLQITMLFILFVTLIGYISVERNPDNKSDPKEIVVD